MLQDQSLTKLPESEVGGEGWLAGFFESISFSPIIDVPLALVFLLLSLLYFRSWANSANSETSIDLPSLLPTACIRAALFILLLLAFCYFTSIGFWVVFVMLFAIGVVGTVVLANDNALEFVLFVSVIVFREACFGFPELVLRGVPDTGDNSSSRYEELIGLTGSTTSPLRPSGYIRINGEELPAVSDTGEMIDAGSEVIVKEMRNGQLRVQIKNSQKTSD